MNNDGEMPPPGRHFAAEGPLSSNKWPSLRERKDGKSFLRDCGTRETSGLHASPQ